MLEEPLFTVFTKHRTLVWEMTKRDIRDKYVGQVFGVLWSIGHPIFLMGLYIFIFAYVFPAKIGGTESFPRSYILYLLAGLIPWLVFQEAMSRSVVVIANNASLVKQIVFPLEILPIKTVLSGSIGLFVSLCIVGIVQLFEASHIPWTWVLLPIALIGLGLAMIGVALLLSCIGVYIKDLKDFVQVFVTANLFMQPIFFIPGRIPEAFENFFYVNPFSYQVWVFQDILYYGRIQHPFAWLVYLSGSILVFVLGLAVFSHVKPKFGEAL